jgi:hypothetical protein
MTLDRRGAARQRRIEMLPAGHETFREKGKGFPEKGKSFPSR